MNDAAGALLSTVLAARCGIPIYVAIAAVMNESCAHWAHRHTGLCAALCGAVAIVLVIIGASIAIEVTARLFG